MKKAIGITIGALGIGAVIAAFTGRKKPETAIPPVRGPVHPRGRFDTMRPGGAHNATDIMIPEGTPIVSPMAGVVKSVFYNSLGGNQIIIVHTNGMITGYAHLSRFAVRAGQQVNRGQLIGYSGNTGQSTGPHLHFTLRTKDGRAVDPEKYFKF